MIVTLISADVLWEQREDNLSNYSQILDSLNYKTDLIVFPEMFSTGFTMNPLMQESMDGESVNWLIEMSKKHNTAIIASVPINYYNRLLFVAPSGIISFYDKRHLFRMGKEDEIYKMGYKKNITSYKGFNFCLNICYDIRFPVWSRNLHNEYDVLLYIANFPSSRIKAAHVLSKARAIENSSYVLFVNRVGSDPNAVYKKSSIIIDYKGEQIGEEVTNNNISNDIQIIRADLDLFSLNEFRQKFPVWMDADDFELL